MYSIEALKDKYENETYQIIGAAMEVHRQLGCGFLEYETGLLINFGESSLKHHRLFNARRKSV